MPAAVAASSYMCFLSNIFAAEEQSFFAFMLKAAHTAAFLFVRPLIAASQAVLPGCLHHRVPGVTQSDSSLSVSLSPLTVGLTR